MFALPTLDAIHRFAAALMTLVHAVAPIARAGGTHTFSERAAHSVCDRLSRLLATLVRLATEGPGRHRTRAEAQPNPDAPARTPAAPRTPNDLRTENWRLKSEPGWLLEALPDTAPALAAEIAALLADPAMAALLDAEPGLRRTLNPLLRSLGLAPIPAPTASPPGAAPPAAPGPTSPSPPPHAHAPHDPTPPKCASPTSSRTMS